jgi:hypothetical protein
MKWLLLFALLASQAAPYAGTWTAEHQGRTFIRLQLTTVDSAPHGTLGTGNIHVDKDGVVDEAEDVPFEDPIENIVVNGSTIAFARKDGNDIERFELRILGNDTAELILLPSEEVVRQLKQEGIPLPKPIRLQRRR